MYSEFIVSKENATQLINVKRAAFNRFQPHNILFLTAGWAKEQMHEADVNFTFAVIFTGWLLYLCLGSTVVYVYT